jgi:hypothetical protein
MSNPVLDGDRGGFTVDTETHGPVALVKMKAWGFWDEALARKWFEAATQAFTKVQAMKAARWCVLVDNSKFPAQLDQVKALIGQAMQRATQLGMSRSAVVLDNTLTKLQLRRVAQESGMPGLTFHVSAAEALAEVLKA